jgi:hypothetical protein
LKIELDADTLLISVTDKSVLLINFDQDTYLDSEKCLLHTDFVFIVTFRVKQCPQKILETYCAK